MKNKSIFNSSFIYTPKFLVIINLYLFSKNLLLLFLKLFNLSYSKFGKYNFSELNEIMISQVQCLLKRAAEYKKTGNFKKESKDKIMALKLYILIDEYYENLDKINELANN